MTLDLLLTLCTFTRTIDPALYLSHKQITFNDFYRLQNNLSHTAERIVNVRVHSVHNALSCIKGPNHRGGGGTYTLHIYIFHC